MSGKRELAVSRRERIFWILMALLVMGAIFWLSSWNTVKSEDFSDRVADVLHVEQTEAQTRASNRPLIFGLTLRKLAHIFLFACLGLCVAEALKGFQLSLRHGQGHLPLRIPGTVVLCYLYAMADEWHQELSGRHGRWEDTLIDLIGIGLGIIGALVLDWVVRKIRNYLAGRRGKEAA